MYRSSFEGVSMSRSFSAATGLTPARTNSRLGTSSRLGRSASDLVVNIDFADKLPEILVDSSSVGSKNGLRVVEIDNIDGLVSETEDGLPAFKSKTSPKRTKTDSKNSSALDDNVDLLDLIGDAENGARILKRSPDLAGNRNHRGSFQRKNGFGSVKADKSQIGPKRIQSKNAPLSPKSFEAVQTSKINHKVRKVSKTGRSTSETNFKPNSLILPKTSSKVGSSSENSGSSSRRNSSLSKISSNEYLSPKLHRRSTKTSFYSSDETVRKSSSKTCKRSLSTSSKRAANITAKPISSSVPIHKPSKTSPKKTETVKSTVNTSPLRTSPSTTESAKSPVSTSPSETSHNTSETVKSPVNSALSKTSSNTTTNTSPSSNTTETGPSKTNPNTTETVKSSVNTSPNTTEIVTPKTSPNTTETNISKTSPNTTETVKSPVNPSPMLRSDSRNTAGSPPAQRAVPETDAVVIRTFMDPIKSVQQSAKFRPTAQHRRVAGLGKKEEGKWKGPFCFIQSADTQFGMMNNFGNMDREPKWDKEIDLFRQAIQAANAMKPKPRFFVVCGDLVDAMPGVSSKPDQVRDFKAIFTELSPDIHPICVCGNHDVGDTPTPSTIESYRKDFGDDYFSFWVGGCKFVVVNSQFYHDCSETKELKDNQEKWLSEELNSDKSWKHMVGLQHIPPFVKTVDEEAVDVPGNAKLNFNFRDKKIRREFVEKLKSAGMRKLFCGHYHRNAGGFDGDFEVIVTSAIGCQLGKDDHGLRLVKVFEDRIEHTYYSMKDIPKTVDFSKK